MRLTGFRYLRRQRIFILALILVMASILFTITAFSLLGFYRGFNAYVGEEENIIAIYDKQSRTPFTGLVPTYLAERISAIDGVLASSPEVLVPCYLKDEAIFLRGIVPKQFTELNQLNMLDGDMLELNDLNSMIVGKRLAEKLKLKTGDKALILGIATDRYAEVQIKGIFESHTAMDDEVLTPLYVGQWFRVDYGYVTLIRFKIDRSIISPAMIFEEVSKEASNPSQNETGEQKPPEQSITQITPIEIRRVEIEKVGVEKAQSFMKSYLDAYGVTRESLFLLSIMVFSFASATVVSASRILIHQHKSEIEVLKSVGASNRTIKTDLLAKVLPWSLAFSMTGTGIGILALLTIERNGYLQVLSHGISFQFDPLILALQLIFTSLIVAISILHSFKSQI